MRHALRIAIVLAVLVIAEPALAATRNVSIRPNGFVPTRVVVNAGDTVRWTNNDTVNRQVVSNSGHFVSRVLRPRQTYQFTFSVAGTYRYHDGLKPAQTGTVVVQGPPPSVSIAASDGDIEFGTGIHLAGVISSREPNRMVRIFGQPSGQASFVEVATVTTTTGGVFDTAVAPTSITNYYAQWGARRSAVIAVQVRTKLTLTRRAGFFIAKATAGRSYNRRWVFIQRRNAFGQWITLKRVFLNASSAQRFKTRLPRGKSLLRVLMPSEQAGPGYLGNVSRTFVFRRP